MISNGRTYGEGTSAPSATTTDLAVVAEEVESGLVAEGNVDDTVVRKSAHGSESSALLSTALGSGRDEQARVLAPEAAGLPLLAGVVPEGSPLRGEVAVARGDAHQEGIVLLEDGRVGDLGDGGVLGGSVHLGQNILGEGLGHAVEVDGAAGLADALGLGLGEGLDVSPGGVLEGTMLAVCWVWVPRCFSMALLCETKLYRSINQSRGLGLG